MASSQLMAKLSIHRFGGTEINRLSHSACPLKSLSRIKDNRLSQVNVSVAANSSLFDLYFVRHDLYSVSIFRFSVRGA